MTKRRRGKSAATRRAGERKARALWTPTLEFPDTLPVNRAREDIVAALRASPVIIVAGDTGSGKTTQIPKLCLAAGFGVSGQIGLTQPRRLAAHAVAARLADETGLPVGEGVGVKVRFDDRAAASAPLKVMTDGIALNEVAADPTLRDYDVIIVDEAHERSLNIDFLLGCLKRALASRDDLKVVITSATINTAEFSQFFDGAPVIDVAGRSFPVDVEYQPLEAADAVARGIESAASDLAARLPTGDILVFLPGEREILDAQKYLTKRKSRSGLARWEILAVFGRLPDADQRRVFSPGAARRILLATNIAETSLTLPRIHAVIDTGLVRISRVALRSRIQRLQTERVSMASARQRAGRCGRLGPGICIRLYTEDELAAQPEYTDPEVQRTDLASVTLRMLAAGLGAVESFPWLDAPDARRVQDSLATLKAIEAINASGQLTSLGRTLARFPVDPRLARVLAAAADRGVLDEALTLVAAMSVGDPRMRPPEQRAKADAAHAEFAGKHADFETYLNIWDAWERLAGGNRRWMTDNFLSPRRLFDWRAVRRQLARQCDALRPRKNAAPSDAVEALSRACIAGFASQLGQRETDGSYRGARGAVMQLHPGSALSEHKPTWILALTPIRTRHLYAREVIAIKPRWLLDEAAHLVSREHSAPRWSAQRRIAVATETVSLFGLVVAVNNDVVLEPHDAALAREIFIRHALVLDEAELDLEFMDQYRDALADVEREEGRRRKSLLRTARAREDWFAERLPQAVSSLKSLLAELDSDPMLAGRLTVSASDIAELSGDDSDALPATAELGGVKLPLDYTYAPGKKGDGVAVAIPASLHGALTAADIDAAVPQLLRERVLLYLKHLPKALRKRLHPLGEAASDISDQLADAHDDLPFRDRLRLLLAADFGVRESDLARWAEIDSDEHLRPNVEILPDVGANAATEPAMAPVRSWSFGDLGASGSGPFTALARVGDDGVVVRTFLKQALADKSHIEAVLELVAHAASGPLSILKKALAATPLVSLRLRQYVAVEALPSRLGRLAVRALAPDDVCLTVRSEVAFEALSATVRGNLAGTAAKLTATLAEIAAELSGVDAHIAAGALAEDVAADVDTQLRRLLSENFPDPLKINNYNDLPRYIKAINYRLDRLPTNPARDREAMATARRYERRLNELPRVVANQPEAEDYRWAVEELRVSLFAQSLGTAMKVSPQRLEKRWQSLLKSRS